MCALGWYLLGFEIDLSHTQIGTSYEVPLKLSDEHPLPKKLEVPPPGYNFVFMYAEYSYYCVTLHLYKE